MPARPAVLTTAAGSPTHGWWELLERNERRFVFGLHGTGGTRRYALIDTGRGWLVHLTREQP